MKTQLLQKKEPQTVQIEPPQIMPTLPTSYHPLGIFRDMETFQNSIQMARAMARSSFIPDKYKGNESDCLMAIDLGQRMNISPFEVLYYLVPVYGKPSWESKFMISRVNNSGKFGSPIQWEWFGDPSQDLMSWGARAYVLDKKGNKLFGSVVTVRMAVEEGWYEKKDKFGKPMKTKWQTMTEQMLRYRSAAFFVRTTCPEVLMGMMTTEEIIDIHNAEANNEKKTSLFESESPSQTPPPLPPTQQQETIEQPQAQEAVVCDERPKKQPKQKDLTQDTTLFDDTDVKIGEWMKTNCLEPHTIDEVKEACTHAGIQYGAYLLDNGAQGMQTVLQYMVRG